MVSFSKRYGYSNSCIQYESMDDILKHRIWSEFYDREIDLYDVFEYENALTNIERMMSKMGIDYQFPESVAVKRNNADKLKVHLLHHSEWYLMYDFIEKYLELLNNDVRKSVIRDYNKILEEEASGYRIVNGLIAPIINENELQAIDLATRTPYETVNTHLHKAISLFADRKMPDYENSIKESISAVEALCKTIVGDDKATLGQALKKLETNGIRLHSALKNALDSLYGYTSDEKGIRHAGIDFKNASSEDARFMLVICSAFVSYLINKYEKND